MKYAPLGRAGPIVSRIGFGCMSLPTDQSASTTLLHRAVDAGITFFDTADFYQHGANETMVGQAFRGMRDRVVLASKVGNRWNADGVTWRWDPSPAWIMESIHGTLARLQTDHLDLYQLHGGTLEDPIDDIIATFERLKDDGLIRHYGISSIRPTVIREWIARSRMTSVMMQYSLLDRRPEEEMLPLLHRHEIGVIARGPLAKGLLSSKPAAAYLDHDAGSVAAAQGALDAVASGSRSRAQAALQFVLGEPGLTTAIPGASSVGQLDENVRDAGALTPAQLTALGSAVRAATYDAHR